MAVATPLVGKRLVVTGGFGVLGRAVATLAAAEGARIAIIDRAPAGDIATPAEFGFSGIDLTDREKLSAALAGPISAWGGIDGLFNIAGAFEWQTFEDGGSGTWLRLFEANLLSAVGATAAVLPVLRDGAAIVNVAAAAARRGAAGMGPYSASKAAVLRFTESLAEELAPRGIRVCSVSPTILDTPRNRADMPDADRSGWIAPARLAQRMLTLLHDGTPTGGDIVVSSESPA